MANNPWLFISIEDNKSPSEINRPLRTVEIIAGKKNPAIQKIFISFSIEIKF